MLYSNYDFSDTFQSFVLKLMKNDLEENDDTFSIFQYYDLFCNEDAESVSNIDSLKEKTSGYLLFNVTSVGDRIRNDPKINDNNSMHYIRCLYPPICSINY